MPPLKFNGYQLGCHCQFLTWNSKNENGRPVCTDLTLQVMTLPSLGRLTNIAALSPLLQDLWQPNFREWQTNMHLSCSWWCCYHILVNWQAWLYLFFYKTYNNQTWQDSRQICTNLTFQMRMMSQPHLTNIYGFLYNNQTYVEGNNIVTNTRSLQVVVTISIYARPITSHCRLVDHYVQTLP